MYVGYNAYTEFGAPEIDPKRPYGNGDVLGDMCDILGLDQPDFDSGEEYTNEKEANLNRFHKETTKAIAILLQHLKIEAGEYHKHGYREWVRA